MALPPSHRIASRYLLAAGAFGPELHKVENLIRQDSFSEARTALDVFLNRKLQVRVTLSSERANILTEWAAGLDPDELRRFYAFVERLLAVRNALKWKPEEKVHAMLENLKHAEHELPWIESVSRDVTDEFKHGPFTIILTKGAENGIDEAIATLDAAAAKIRPKFPKVLYGKVYVRRGLRPSDPAPQSKAGQVAGSYVGATDTVNLSLYATPDRDSILTLIHEFGHRYHTRFFTGDQRERFIELSTVGDVRRAHFNLAERRGIAAEWMDRFREHQKENYPDEDLSERAQLWMDNYSRDEYRAKVVPLLKRFRDDKDNSVEAALEHAIGQYQYGGNLEVIIDAEHLRPLYASFYGETNWQENFAESFLYFVIGKALPQPLHDFMASL